jgi:hypothetical protein
MVMFVLMVMAVVCIRDVRRWLLSMAVMLVLMIMVVASMLHCRM